MKNYFVLIVAAILLSCNSVEDGLSEDSNSKIERRELNTDQVILKEKLSEAALIVASICNDNDIVTELASFINDQPNKFISRVKFKELLDIEMFKSTGRQGKFSSAFRDALNQNHQKSANTIIDYLIENGVEIYIPFGVDGYPEGTDIVVTSDPLDNDFENIGYFVSDINKTVMANEELSEIYPIIIIRDSSLSYDEIISAKANDNSDKNLKSTSLIDPMSVWSNELYKFEIYIDKVYIKNDYITGLFPSPATLYVSTGNLSFNSATSAISDLYNATHNVFSVVLDRQKVRWAREKGYLQGFHDTEQRWIQDWHPGMNTLQWSFYLDRPKVTNKAGHKLVVDFLYEATIDILKLTQGGSSEGSAETTSESNDHLFVSQQFYRSTYKQDYNRKTYWSQPNEHQDNHVYVNSNVGYRAVSQIHADVFFITHCEALLR